MSTRSVISCDIFHHTTILILMYIVSFNVYNMYHFQCVYSTYKPDPIGLLYALLATYFFH